MKNLLLDPVVLISAGAILFGVIGFIWGLSKFRQLRDAADAPDDDFLASVQTPAEPAFRAPLNVSPVAANAPPAVSRDVAERLESMTQRLSEMQAVLTKQSTAQAAGATPGAGGVGQGFSPETIDKLLKIVGNVIQQVDILQKSVTPK